jgi:hypothetical protein
LEGATYASTKFGSKSEIARWSADVTAQTLRRVLDTAGDAKDNVDGGFGAFIAHTSAERSVRGAERALLGVDARRRVLVTTPVDDDDVDMVRKFNIKAVQWAVAVILVGTAAGAIFALLGMPLIRDPLLYNSIPYKLD